MTRLRLGTVSYFASLIAALWMPVSQANVVLDWNAVMMAGVRVDNTGPTLSTRNLAILHLAIYDAVNTVERTHQPYLFQPEVTEGTSTEAAVVGAGYEVLKVLYPSLRARADDAFESWRATAPNTPATDHGLALGRRIAESMLAARANDGSATDVPYIPSAEPGQWRRTPPFFRPPVTPQWRYVTPFAVPDIDPFVPLPPPALDSVKYATALNEVKALGSKSSTVRTAEQTQIAVFWSDFSYTAMPPGHWHEIAASIVQSQGTGLADTARLMALLSLAQADAAIVCWEAKYRYNLWRPVTAIQRASEDGNDATEADPTWDHLLGAPPFPSYTSGHSSFSKASAEIIADFYGTDALTFTAASDSLPGVFRTFQSLSACADEIGLSRIYGGIHFSFDNVAGKASGRLIAQHVAANFLLPNEQLPLVRIERLWDQPSVRLHGHPGAQLILESSTDFTHWHPLATNTAVMGGVAVSLQNPKAGPQFFRILETPLP